MAIPHHSHLSFLLCPPSLMWYWGGTDVHISPLHCRSLFKTTQHKSFVWIKPSACNWDLTFILDAPYINFVFTLKIIYCNAIMLWRSQPYKKCSKLQTKESLLPNTYFTICAELSTWWLLLASKVQNMPQLFTIPSLKILVIQMCLPYWRDFLASKMHFTAAVNYKI